MEEVPTTQSLKLCPVTADKTFPELNKVILVDGEKFNVYVFDDTLFLFIHFI